MGLHVLDLDVELRPAILVDGSCDGEHVIQLLEVVVDDILLPNIVFERAALTLVLV